MEDGEDRTPRKLQAALIRSFIVGSPTKPSRTISTYFESWGVFAAQLWISLLWSVFLYSVVYML